MLLRRQGSFARRLPCPKGAVRKTGVSHGVAQRALAANAIALRRRANPSHMPNPQRTVSEPVGWLRSWRIAEKPSGPMTVRLLSLRRVSAACCSWRCGSGDSPAALAGEHFLHRLPGHSELACDVRLRDALGYEGEHQFAALGGEPTRDLGVFDRLGSGFLYAAKRVFV